MEGTCKARSGPALLPLPGSRAHQPCQQHSLDTCRRIRLDRAVPNLFRAKHWYSPSYSSGRPPLRKSITRVPDLLLMDTRGSLAMLKNLLLRVQWKLWTTGDRSNHDTGAGARIQANLRFLVSVSSFHSQFHRYTSMALGPGLAGQSMQSPKFH
jgi:hypothetical protein